MMNLFASLYTFQLFSSFSTNMLLVVLTALVYNNGGSVSILMISMTIPSLVFAKTAGAVIDKYDSRKILFVLILLEMTFLAALFIDGMYEFPLALYAFSLFVYATDVFIRLYLQSAVVYITTDKHYLEMNSVLNGIENLSVIVGPILGGLLIERYPPSRAFFFLGACFFVTLLSAALLRVPKRSRKFAGGAAPEAPAEAPGGAVAEIRRLCLALCAFSFSIGLANVRQISFVIEQYKTAEFGYGLTESAWGAGMTAGCFIVFFISQAHPKKILGACCGAVGAVLLLLAASTWFPVGLFLFFLVGVGNIIVSIAATTWVQQLADVDSIGRTLGLKTMFQQISTVIAMSCGGLLEPCVSSRQLYGIAGAILLAGGLLVLFHWKNPVHETGKNANRKRSSP